MKCIELLSGDISYFSPDMLSNLAAHWVYHYVWGWEGRRVIPYSNSCPVSGDGNYPGPLLLLLAGHHNNHKQESLVLQHYNSPPALSRIEYNIVRIKCWGNQNTSAFMTSGGQLNHSRNCSWFNYPSFARQKLYDDECSVAHWWWLPDFYFIFNGVLKMNTLFWLL